MQIRGPRLGPSFLVGTVHARTTCAGFRWGARGLRWEFLGTGFWELATPCEGRCVPRSCPEGATGESGVEPRGPSTQPLLCPERAHETGSVRSPFAPLGRDVLGWGDPGFRSAPPWAFSVRRVAARAGAGCISGGCVPKGTTADFRCQSPAVTTLNQDVTGRVPPRGAFSWKSKLNLQTWNSPCASPGEGTRPSIGNCPAVRCNPAPSPIASGDAFAPVGLQSPFAMADGRGVPVPRFRVGGCRN
jgi:hypothetical protein